MSVTQILALAGGITVVVGALGGLAWVLKIVLRLARLLGDIHEDWSGEQARPGVPARKGVMERLSFIETELTFNGGRTTKDMIRSLAQALESTTRQVEDVARLQSQYHPVSPVQINMSPGHTPVIEGGADGGR